MCDKYLGLKSNRHLGSKLQKSREDEVLVECNDLYDVSVVDALDYITDEEVKNFLIMQRQKGRPGSKLSIFGQKTRKWHNYEHDFFMSRFILCC